MPLSKITLCDKYKGNASLKSKRMSVKNKWEDDTSILSYLHVYINNKTCSRLLQQGALTPLFKWDISLYRQPPSTCNTGLDIAIFEINKNFSLEAG